MVSSVHQSIKNKTGLRPVSSLQWITGLPAPILQYITIKVDGVEPLKPIFLMLVYDMKKREDVHAACKNVSYKETNKIKQIIK